MIQPHNTSMDCVQTAEGAGAELRASPTTSCGSLITPSLALCPSEPSSLLERPVPCSLGCLHSGSPGGVAPMSCPAVWPWHCGRPRCGVLPWALESVRGGECVMSVDSREGEVGWGSLGPWDPVSPLAGLHGGGRGMLGSEGQAGLTCLPDKDLLRGTQRPLTHSIVHAHSDFISPVLVQVCG